MKKTAIFGGTFNPIHCGHVAIGRQLIEKTDLDEVWFMVSPLNPFKEGQTLLADDLRLAMVKAALRGHRSLKASDHEFALPRPSYMWNTLLSLRKRYPRREFSLVIGADNWPRFGDWYHSADIIATTPLFIFPREGTAIEEGSLPEGVHFVDMPLVNVSSTEVRRRVAAGESISGLVPAAIEADVLRYYR